MLMAAKNLRESQQTESGLWLGVVAREEIFHPTEACKAQVEPGWARESH